MPLNDLSSVALLFLGGGDWRRPLRISEGNGRVFSAEPDVIQFTVCGVTLECHSE